VAPPKLRASSAAAGLADELGPLIAGKVGPHGNVAGAVGLQPAAAPSVARATLWRLLQTAIDKRSAMLVAIGDRLRAGIPKVLARSPLRLEHFGFTSLDQMVAHVLAGLAEMETSARTAADFNRGLKGWRWNVAGRLLFERLVKFHPGLDAFLSGLATDLFGLIANEAGERFVTLVDGTGATRRVTPDFGAPRKVVEFKLRGADGVLRAYTDFGFVGRNKQGLWGGLLIEIKMPAALAAVAEQFSEFLPRLKEAQELIIVFLDETGTAREQSVRPADFVLMQHERGQLAVAPLSVKQGQKLLSQGPVLPGDVGKVVSFAPAVSPRFQLTYYKARVLVQREWLVDIVRLITDPP
jgi:hypothetical protein